MSKLEILKEKLKMLDDIIDTHTQELFLLHQRWEHQPMMRDLYGFSIIKTKDQILLECAERDRIISSIESLSKS